jgi:hypothetical protein
MSRYILLLLGLLFVIGCTDVTIDTGVEVCQSAGESGECSEDHDESDNSDSSTTDTTE